MYTSEIQHNGKKIIFTRFSNLSEAEMMEAIKAQFELVKRNPGKVLLLDDFNNTAVNNEFMNTAKQLGREYGDKIDKYAVLGVTGLKKILLTAYNAFATNPAHPFSTQDEAVKFLAA
ncbi:MAG: hypothetical protein ACFHWX_23185 [Bacteroidota bacterium]